MKNFSRSVSNKVFLQLFNVNLDVLVRDCDNHFEKWFPIKIAFSSTHIQKASLSYNSFSLSFFSLSLFLSLYFSLSISLSLYFSLFSLSLSLSQFLSLSLGLAHFCLQTMLIHKIVAKKNLLGLKCLFSNILVFWSRRFE